MFQQDKKLKSVIFYSKAGCLLPFLIITNLFFGWIFIKPVHWLTLELVLIMLFIVNLIVITRKISSLNPKHDNVIDVEGKIIKDTKTLS